MKLNNIQKVKKGISLIVLIITIIVVIIIAATVILTLSQNNPINSAKEASFREEIANINDQIALQIMQCERYGTKLENKFEQVKLDDVKKMDMNLKFEIIYWGGYILSDDITYLSNDYVKTNQNEILEDNSVEINGTKYINNLYYIDKEIVGGKKQKYLYDTKVNQIYKVPVTNIGKIKVHSVEELNYLKGNENGERELIKRTVISQESSLVKVGNVSCYEPNLNGFVEEQTSVIYFKVNSDGTFNGAEDIVPVKNYLSNKQRTLVKNNSSYEFYNYENKIWANIKVESAGVETYWVWIPRYAYKIEGNETKVIYIDINNKQTINGEDLPEGYIVHPAFNDGKKGIWVSKYEVEQIDNKIEGFSHYLPDLSGFDKNNTYIEVYNDDGSFSETKLSDVGNIAQFAREKRWFNYEKQIWANIKTISNGVECWWVWIPRYAYKIEGNTTSVIFIDTKNRPLTGEILPNGYIVHPAFNDGKKGIWASKYEISEEN